MTFRSAMVPVLFLSSALSAQTVDEIVAKTLAARGGVDKIKSIQTQRMTGQISLGPEAEGPFLVEIKRGNKMREEMTMAGKTDIRAINGSSGWVADGEGPSQPLPEDAVRNMTGGADIDGPLLDYKAKGNKVELLGKEAIEGKDAYKLKVTLADGQVRFEFIDCESLLGVKWQGSIANDGKEFEVESFFRDYRKVDGVMFAFLIDSDTVGMPNKQKITFDKIETNVPLDDGLFARPK